MYDGVSRDVLNLGYTPEDVAKCVRNLSGADFDKPLTVPNTGKGVPFLRYDAYVTTFTPAHRTEPDRLYIKLRLNAAGIWLGSFHLSR
jgi:hypothetical protein